MNTLKKLQKNRKGGVSVIIATIMSMIILMLAISQIFIFEAEIQSEDMNRKAESFTIDMIYTLSNTTSFKVSNIGTVAIRLVAIWINNTRNSIDVMLNPLDTQTIDMDGLGLTVDSVFDATIVTKRGLAVTFNYSPSPEQAPEDVQTTGVFKLNWFFFKYTSLRHPNRTEAMVVHQSEDYVALYFKITNNWIYPCKIVNMTQIQFVIPYIEVPMFIVQNVSYPSHSVTALSSPIILNPQQEGELIFVSTVARGTSWAWGTSIPPNMLQDNPSCIGAIQLSIFYEINGELHGQVLSAQGLYFPP